jgi:carbamoyl-phosphate synthase large subunit
VPSPDRLDEVAEAIRRGADIDEIAALTFVDPWFLDQIAQIVHLRMRLEADDDRSPIRIAEVKRFGFSDGQLAHLWGTAAHQVREMRRSCGIEVTYKTVDTCAAEFEAETPTSTRRTRTRPRRRILVAAR